MDPTVNTGIISKYVFLIWKIGLAVGKIINNSENNKKLKEIVYIINIRPGMPGLFQKYPRML